MIKSRKIIKKEIEYYSICGKCKKVIKGSTESQVKYNLDIHTRAKHKNNQSTKEKKVKN